VSLLIIIFKIRAARVSKRFGIYAHNSTSKSILEEKAMSILQKYYLCYKIPLANARGSDSKPLANACGSDSKLFANVSEFVNKHI